MDILTTIKTKGYKFAHTCYKHRSAIAFVSGGLFIAGGTVKLIHDADKIAEVNKQVKADRAQYKEINKKGKEGWEEFGEGKCHYILSTGVNHTLDYVKTAGIGIGLEAIGYGLCTYAMKTEHDNYVAASMLAAANANLLANYRKRYLEDGGTLEKDHEYLTGEKIVTMTSEDGTLTTVEETVNNGDRAFIPHSFLFDETHKQWTKSNSVNRDTMDTWLRVINHELSIKQFLTENDMRDICKTERTKIGNTAGVRYQNPDGTTNAVVFNEYAMERFLAGDERSALMIFEYADGRPIEDNIMLDINWETGL